MGSGSPTGIVLIDKPQGMTSHDVVSRLRYHLATKKVGHAGTLDPMATGLLVLGVGAGTRLLTYAVGLDKTYRATIRLGAATITDDADGEQVGEQADTSAVTGQQIHDAISPLTGSIMQVPSAVSAIRVDGKRSYARVRGGEEVQLAARPVTVSRFEVLDVRRTDGFIDVDAVIDCSSGTYIRALARDLGVSLGVGGHLTALRRTHVGEWCVDGASKPPERNAPRASEYASQRAAEGASEGAVEGTAECASPIRLLGLGEFAAHLLPIAPITEAEARALSFGQPIPMRELAGTPAAAIVPQTGRLAAIVEPHRGALKPAIVFSNA